MALRQGPVRVRAAPTPTDRLTTPLLRERGLEPVSFGEALTWVADRCTEARVAFLAGGRLLDEDAYALSKLARTVLRTNDLDHRRRRRRPRPSVVGPPADADGGHLRGRRARAR